MAHSGGRLCATSQATRTVKTMSSSKTAQPTWMTVDDVCTEIGISRSTFDKWRAKGVGPAARKLPNGSLRIARADFDGWLDGLPEAA